MRRNVIVKFFFAQGTMSHCAIMIQGTTVTSDHSATMTYVMWREEHLWNVSFLQRETPFTILFDFSEPNYSDQLVKENAWKATGEKMETPAKL
jgi:hypothetical protein